MYGKGFGLWGVGKRGMCEDDWLCNAIMLTTKVFRIVLVRRMYKNNICGVVSV